MNTAEEKISKPQKNAESNVGIWFLIPLVVVLIGVFSLASDWKDTLIVERVAVEGARIMTAKDIVSLTNIQPQATLYETDLFSVQQRLLAQPMIKIATVTRKLPDALRIEIIEREPLAILSNNQMSYIDNEGIILPHVTSATFDLPIITGIIGLDSVRLGHVLNKSDIFDAIHILESAQAFNIYRAISEVSMNNGGDIILYSNEGGVPIVIGRGDIDKKLETLQSFWSQFAKSDVITQLRSVDLRYDGQVVVKWNYQEEMSKSSSKLFTRKLSL